VQEQGCAMQAFSLRRDEPLAHANGALSRREGSHSTQWHLRL